MAGHEVGAWGHAFEGTGVQEVVFGPGGGQVDAVAEQVELILSMLDARCSMLVLYFDIKYLVFLVIQGCIGGIQSCGYI